MRFRAAILMSAQARLGELELPEADDLASHHLHFHALPACDELVIGDGEHVLLPKELPEGGLHAGDGVRDDKGRVVRVPGADVAENLGPLMSTTEHVHHHPVVEQHGSREVHVGRAPELVHGHLLPVVHEALGELFVRADVAELPDGVDGEDFPIALQDAERGLQTAPERRARAVLDHVPVLLQVFAELDCIGARLGGQDVLLVVTVTDEQDRGHEALLPSKPPKGPWRRVGVSGQASEC
ncbi:MAG: hypothetical protein UV82_C0008G0033 [Candidatus Magasanikbacteria bacterium GW2011_GWD2_43_18]|nr:MAG: hypothetical protein UV18_C0002G0016 [Candidatus Magasanikbacteria bacterium GW2011_GWC2_42_27]KKT04429.1 MAG: hypothetical protein UV82_C0008G0033 [Candidatus Magasanikbacteria bacterium GW2011_GWD2_43_18]KKT26060.1 MAG: hypothetical protein UW10_C0002G0060 [Candidatus Magasanikbacteria bacterium GW2011_GWA2_43_9]